MYNFAFHEDPMVSGLIMSSGTAFIENMLNAGVPGPKYSNFSYVASHLGCDSSSAEKELACMKKVDAAIITDFLANNTNIDMSDMYGGLAFSAVADERVVFANYTDRALRGKLARVVSWQCDLMAD